MKRRNILSLVGIVLISTLTVGLLSSFTKGSAGFDGHKFPELGYAYNALEPYIDAQTMEIHYSRHHKAYYTNFMNAAEGTDMLKTPLEQIFANMSKHSEIGRASCRVIV